MSKKVEYTETYIANSILLRGGAGKYLVCQYISYKKKLKVG